MSLIAALPALTPPAGGDIVGVLPEVILASGFILLLLLDLFVPAQRRNWLAVFTVLAIAATGAAVVWGWFDAASPRTVYFGSFAYDRFSLFIDGILLTSALLVVLISPDYLNRRGIHYGEYYSLILAATTGMMLLAGASSLMVIFLAVELLSISLYILSGFARTEPRSQEAGMKYLLLGGFASGFLLYGMALIYGETGHTQLQQIFIAVKTTVILGGDPLLVVGAILLFVGFAFKISAAPFHMWTPDVYQGAPTAVTMFMSVATKVAAFAALIRVFSYTFPDLYVQWDRAVIIVAVLSMVVGNLVALSQTSVKRMLAYSGIAQAGYILIGVAVDPHDGTGTVAALYYLAAYALTNLGAFAVITIMAGKGEDLDHYDNLKGLAYRRPYIAAAMGLFMLSLAGFPPTAGFFGKFLVFSAAMKNGQSALALWGIATSAISVFYYLRVTLLMYSKTETDNYEWSPTSAAGAAVIAVTTLGTLAFGVFVSVLYSLAVSAQHGLIPGS